MTVTPHFYTPQPALYFGNDGPVKSGVRPTREGLSPAELVAASRTTAFTKEFEGVLAQARQYLEESLSDGYRGIVCLDLDETLLDNRDEIAKLAAINSEGLTAISLKGESGSFPETLAFIKWMDEQKAAGAKLDYYFLSGKPKEATIATESNLERIGVRNHSGLLLHDWSTGETTTQFKARMREQLKKQYPSKKVRIVSIGDQNSDVIGPWINQAYKLPNRIYLTS